MNGYHSSKDTGTDYPAIRAWGAKLGSYGYYIDNELKRARATKAPQDAIHARTDFNGHITGWARIKDIKDLDKRADMKVFLDIQEQLS